MALLTFLTVEEADVILGTNLPWASLSTTTEMKQDALEMARIYVEQNYKLNFVESDGVDDKVKIGNALIANENLISDIFTRQSGLGSLEEKTVKADSVTVTKKYTNKISRTWVDPFRKATAIMIPFFILKSGSQIKYKSLIRG